MQTELIFTIAAVITAIGVIIAALVSIYRFVKRISESIGIDRHGRTLSERLDRVEHQLWENGGSSLADRVNVINENSLKTSAEVEIIKDLLINSKTSPLTVVRKSRAKKAS
jgi:hypothetical protein